MVSVKRLSEETSRPGALGEPLKKQRKKGAAGQQGEDSMGGAGAAGGASNDPVGQAALHKEEGNYKLKVELKLDRFLSRPGSHALHVYPCKLAPHDCAHAPPPACQVGEIEEAERLYTLAIELDPSVEAYWTNRALVTPL